MAPDPITLFVRRSWLMTRRFRMWGPIRPSSFPALLCAEKCSLIGAGRNKPPSTKSLQIKTSCSARSIVDLKVDLFADAPKLPTQPTSLRSRSCVERAPDVTLTRRIQTGANEPREFSTRQADHE